jgi:hypothetical protein
VNRTVMGCSSVIFTARSEELARAGESLSKHSQVYVKSNRFTDQRRSGAMLQEFRIKPMDSFGLKLRDFMSSSRELTQLEIQTGER